MAISSVLESVFKYLFLLSVLLAVLTYKYKDVWPEPADYDLALLGPPLQTETDRAPFSIQANGLAYTIVPRFDYDLYGMVVSYSNADGFTNIWHHKRWQDFINVRDLCVIWGGNVESGIYKSMKFDSDSWTCWAYWTDRETGERFAMDALSNNHIVTDNEAVKAALMQAEPGDLIHFSGVLAEYANHATGAIRGTSTTRSDTGQGACETVYTDRFEIVKKANSGLRRLYNFCYGLAWFSLAGFAVMFVLAPHRPRYR